mmetsp:Transcript_11813/g.27064  ORF Transcript_11813/g.27064 Transcript_11813/m.27064 type:complete len:209 (+) Transcript_11813:598-1224(+)
MTGRARARQPMVPREAQRAPAPPRRSRRTVVAGHGHLRPCSLALRPPLAPPNLCHRRAVEVATPVPSPAAAGARPAALCPAVAMGPPEPHLRLSAAPPQSCRSTRPQVGNARSRPSTPWPCRNPRSARLGASAPLGRGAGGRSASAEPWPASSASPPRSPPRPPHAASPMRGSEDAQECADRGRAHPGRRMPPLGMPLAQHGMAQLPR